MSNHKEGEVLDANSLRLEKVRDASVVCTIFEGAYSVLMKFSNGVHVRLRPVEDSWMGFIGETVKNITHASLGRFSFLKIEFASGTNGLFHAK